MENLITLKIPQQMIQNSKDSFTYSAIGKFVGRRPSVEAMERWVHSTWLLSRPCLISLTEHGNFLFRFRTKKDSEALVSRSPLPMGEGKLLLRLWSPGEEENSWPVWIRLDGVPYHCWSSDILLYIARSVGEPLRLDETGAAQRILSYARVLVNLDVSKPLPFSLFVDLGGESRVKVVIDYDSVPRSVCFSAGHLTAKCPFSTDSPQPTLLQTPPSLIQPNSKQNPQPNPAPPTEVNSPLPSPPPDESINKMGEEDDQPGYVSDICARIDHPEINNLLLPLLQDCDGSINEENWLKWKTMISKSKVIKEGLDVLSHKGMGKVRKFFFSLRKLGKKFKKLAKKVKNYANWKTFRRLILLFAAISVLTFAVTEFIVSPSTAPLGLALAGVGLPFLKFLQDWSCKIQKKNHGEDGSSSSLLLEKNGDFEVRAEAEIQNIEKVMERFTGADEEVSQVANSFKRKLEVGIQAIENKMKDVKNKPN